MASLAHSAPLGILRLYRGALHVTLSSIMPDDSIMPDASIMRDASIIPDESIMPPLTQKVKENY